MQAGAQAPAGQTQELPPGAPPAFGTAPPVGPEVSPATFAEAEKLAQVEMTAVDRATAASNWRMQMAPLLERRTGPRKIELEATLAPATQWNPSLPGMVKPREGSNLFFRSVDLGLALPTSEDAIAFATAVQLSRWIERRKLTSTRLTQIYLHRLGRFDAQLRCVITLLRDHALAQAGQADAEIAAGRYRGPLHGIPWGAKDLLDTVGIPTTYGAEPYRDRVPAANATVVDRLNAAGAVLVAKLSLGALALNDIWFGGQTMNPWLLEEGSSGSSAGPGAAVAAGLVGFAIGSETGGSIVSPSMRCGVTGLRPTFGRVPRTGAMTLCWSLDKLGPMARSVEDTVLVLNAISGSDGRDLASMPCELAFDAAADVKGLRVGYFPGWMKEAPATDVDRAALEAVKRLGMTPGDRQAGSPIRHGKADRHPTVLLLARLTAILPRHTHRMGALLRTSGVVHDPGHDRTALLHDRQYIVAHAAKQGLIAPWGLGHHMVQRLVHAPDAVRGQTHGHRLDALTLSRQQQSGAIGLQGNSTIDMPCGLHQAVKIGRKALLPGAWRFGVGAHADSLPASHTRGTMIFLRGINLITQ
jgi:hypothetical protein